METEVLVVGTGPTGLLLAAELRRLGVEGATPLAVRPDHYLGLRHDGLDPARVREYVELVRCGGATGSAA